MGMNTPNGVYVEQTRPLTDYFVEICASQHNPPIDSIARIDRHVLWKRDHWCRAVLVLKKRQSMPNRIIYVFRSIGHRRKYKVRIIGSE